MCVSRCCTSHRAAWLTNCVGASAKHSGGLDVLFKVPWRRWVRSWIANPVSPVYFQPLEQELRPVAQYLSGHLLNAGSGSRDVSSYLLANAVTKITNYDIASPNPGDVVGPLELMPFADR